ncbi:MAG: tetratricopeptide repeat protein, partial [Pseudomonadota bacterium]
IRRAPGRVRISAQLVAVSDGHTLWSDRLDHAMDDLFHVQDEISEKVAAAVQPKLRFAEIRRAESRMPTERTVYDEVLTAYPLIWAHRPDANTEAIATLTNALAKDPNYTLARALRAWCTAAQVGYCWTTDPAGDRTTAQEEAAASIRDMPDHAPTLVAAASAMSLSTDDMRQAKDLCDRALWLDPNNAWGWTRAGWIANYSAKPDDALKHFDRAERLSPLDPFRFNIFFGRAAALRRYKRFDEAIQLIEEGMRINPGATWAHRMLVGTHSLAGNADAARAAARAWKAVNPRINLQYVLACLPPSWDTWESSYVQAMAEVGAHYD